MSFDPKGMMTREHFYGYKPHPNPCMPPPLHVVSMGGTNWHPIARPLQAGGQPGPAVILGGSGMPCLGIDPTDPTTWEGRGYRQSAGMVGRFNMPADWHGNPEQLNPLGMGQ